jgi:[ribosomal protein S5]-alanine N-acetyltransferase
MSTYQTLRIPTQYGTAVDLRSMVPEDAAALQALLSHPELKKHIVMRGEGSHDAPTGKLMHRMLHAFDPCALHAGIYQAGTSELIGTVCLQCWNRRKGSAILGYMMDPSWWGRGYATEAVRLMLKYGSEEMGITEVEGRCKGDNAGSEKVMVKNGMELTRIIPVEGTLNDVIKVFKVVTQMK